MHLKEIQMENFKSFGRKIRIPFNPGFTGVTGPNGSGKSNISDAIIFVLGPRSSKVIRAGKLSDLIFNGGKTGKPAQQCKVSLVFDNADRTIQVDSDEVILTRIVRRTNSSSVTDANSYFYINGKKSSLGEFDLLLSHARISADGYNFVQQGDVNRIATMGPVERRRILDTMAGITRFDEDIQKAEKKKESAIQDIEKINILLDEINVRVSSLDGERTEATKYLELQERLNGSEALITYKRLQGVESEMSALKEQLEQYHVKEQELEEEKRRLESAIQEQDQIVGKLKDEMDSKGGAEVEELREKMDQHRLVRARAADGMEDAKDSLKAMGEEKKRLLKERKEVEKEIALLEEEHNSLKIKAAEIQKILETIRGELKKLEDEAAATDGRIDEFRKEESSLVEALQTQTDQIASMDLESEKLRVEMGSLNREKAGLEEQKKDLEAEAKDAAWEIKETKKDGKETESTKTLQERLYAKKNEERRLTQESTELESAVKRLEREYERAKAQAEMAEKTALGYTPPVMAVLEARDRGELGGVHGTVAELVTATGDLEEALSVAAGSRMQAIVVDTDEDAEKAINLLRTSKLGRATFLPLNKMMESRPRGKAVMAAKDPESMGFAIDLLDFDDRYRAAMWYVFGDTLVVNNIKAARRLMGGIRIVTTQGELIEASGAMMGGTLSKKQKSFGISRGQLEKVGEDLRKARDSADSVLAKLRSIREELMELETRLKEASGRDETVSIRINALKQREAEAKKKLSAAEERISALSKTISEIEAKLDAIKATKEEMEKKAGGTRTLLTKIREKLAGTTPKEVGDRLRHLRQKEKEEMAELAKINDAIAELKPKLAVAKKTNESIIKALAEQEEKASSLKTLMEEKGKEGEKADLELKALSKILSSMSAELEALRTEMETAFKRKMELEKEKEKVLIAMENKEDFYIGLKSKFSSLEEEHNRLESEWGECKREIPEKMPSLETLKKTAQEARVQMEAMGAVNLKALDEYQRQKGRYDKLSEELKQLKSEKKSLEKMVEELVARKTEGLMAVFSSVNENFKNVYSRLSMGGEAELVLEKPETPFEGGLLINARPPGKKVLRLEALSGGEKSLVSMGFIVALQQYDPSPFYLLDEVDQNLDALNAENLARLIRDDSKLAQFIMISLRKVTLKEADTLYGVMAQSSGFSEVIGTVDLQSLKEPEPEPAEQPEASSKETETGKAEADA
ncbi:MAG: chromosome segregation protein SMC [Candidatus Thermoplasmatota archaeon]|nr:chromosome segregation protein SMC [Candidatus Thermoplasmatota archaeon]